MRFLIDCTFIFFNPTLNSGIQRVVRNIVTHALDSQQDIDCIPIFFKDDSVYKLRTLVPGTIERISTKAHGRFNRLFKKLESTLADSPGLSKNLKSKLIDFMKVLIIHIVVFFTRVARYLCKHFRELIAFYDRAQPLEILNDDIIVLLDSTWEGDSHEPIRMAKSRGSIVVAVIYDLIPVTHPHFFDDALLTEYTQWLEWIGKTADGYMAISKTVRDQAKNMMKEKLPTNDFDKRWFDYFYLGSELDLVDDTAIRNVVSSIFSDSLPVYLMVSTIEPRKNHKYLLDAFDELWNHGQRIVLCVVGAVGWKSESFLERVENHPELNKHLFMLNDLNDTELEYAYKHSRALVFSSKEEGFGLPIVEAMQRGLPVMASDISVFREIGKDYCAYFELDDHRSLCKLITKFESAREFPSIKPLKGYRWFTWREATEAFLKTIKEHVAKQVQT